MPCDVDLIIMCNHCNPWCLSSGRCNVNIGCPFAKAFLVLPVQLFVFAYIGIQPILERAWVACIGFSFYPCRSLVVASPTTPGFNSFYLFLLFAQIFLFSKFTHSHKQRRAIIKSSHLCVHAIQCLNKIVSGPVDICLNALQLIYLFYCFIRSVVSNPSVTDQHGIPTELLGWVCVLKS